jgi:hypothetical protein
MWHPFDRFDSQQTGRALAVTSCLTFALGALISVLGQRLRTDVAPTGILALELTGDAASARAIVRSWDYAGVLPWAGFNVGLDYLFIVLYASALAFGCVWAVRPFSSRPLIAAGRALAWMQWGAGLLDAIENVALLMVMGGNPDPLWPRLARGCAVPKFCITAAGLMFITSVYAFGKWRDAFPLRFNRFGV